MSIFTKPLCQIDLADLEELLRDSAVENVRLEFKSKVPDKDETLKKLSSFANTFGGFMIVGAKANSTDGRIEGLPGVANEPGYKQKVTQWCFDAIAPPMTVEVSDAVPVPGGSGSVCFVVHASESDIAPHFMNGRKGVWVRTDEFSQRFEARLATENEIRHLLDRRRLIQERRDELVQRSRDRFERFLSRKLSEENLTSNVSKARLEFSLGPRFPSQPVCEQAQLARALQDRRINWRGTTFPFGNATFVSQHESVLFLMKRDAHNRMLIEANTWGLLFYGTELETDIGDRRKQGPEETPIRGIHLYRLVGSLLAFCRHGAGMISNMGYEGPASINVALSGILNVPWIYVEEYNSIAIGPVSELDDTFSFSLPTTSEILREQSHALVMSILQVILFGMNWSEYAGRPDMLEQLVNSGYKYNSWDPPSTPRVG